MSRRKVKNKGRRVLTRKIIRNYLKFQLRKMGYKHVNRDFKEILSNFTLKEKMELLEIE